MNVLEELVIIYCKILLISPLPLPPAEKISHVYMCISLTVNVFFYQNPLHVGGPFYFLKFS